MSELILNDNLVELDHRENDGLTVDLLYHKVGNEVLLHLVDDGVNAQFSVPREQASDAFQHPWPYYDSYLTNGEPNPWDHALDSYLDLSPGLRYQVLSTLERTRDGGSVEPHILLEIIQSSGHLALKPAT